MTVGAQLAIGILKVESAMLEQLEHLRVRGPVDKREAEVAELTGDAARPTQLGQPQLQAILVSKCGVRQLGPHVGVKCHARPIQPDHERQATQLDHRRLAQAGCCKLVIQQRRQGKRRSRVTRGIIQLVSAQLARRESGLLVLGQLYAENATHETPEPIRAFGRRRATRTEQTRHQLSVEQPLGRRAAQADSAQEAQVEAKVVADKFRTAATEQWRQRERVEGSDVDDDGTAVDGCELDQAQFVAGGVKAARFGI
jgi:hypothetical protein